MDYITIIFKCQNILKQGVFIMGSMYNQIKKEQAAAVKTCPKCLRLMKSYNGKYYCTKCGKVTEGK